MTLFDGAGRLDRVAAVWRYRGLSVPHNLSEFEVMASVSGANRKASLSDMVTELPRCVQSGSTRCVAEIGK